MLSNIQEKYDFSDYQMAQLEYFFKSMLSEFSKMILMGIFFHNELKIYLFSIFIMILLRVTSGGIHCKHYLSCLAVSFSFLFMAIRILGNIALPMTLSLILCIVCAILVYFIGPITAKVRRKLDERVVKNMRIRVTATILLYSLVIIIFPKSHYVNLGSWIIILHTLQLMIARIMKGGTSNEEA